MNDLMRRRAVLLSLFIASIAFVALFFSVRNNYENNYTDDVSGSAITGFAVSTTYKGYAEPVEGFTVINNAVFSSGTNSQILSFTVADDFVYQYAYISINGSAWQRITLSSTTRSSSWFLGSATGRYTISASNISVGNSTRNYVAVYSCKKITNGFDCNEGMWQIRSFKTVKTASGDNSLPSISTDDLTAAELASVRWTYGHDVSGWKITANLNSITFVGDEICTYHSKAGSWPAYRAYEDFSRDAEANPWIFVNENNQWYACPYEWLYSGVECRDDMTASVLKESDRCNIPSSWNPAVGEKVCFMVTTLARNNAYTWGSDVNGKVYNHENQRSNIKCVGWKQQGCTANAFSQCDSTTGDVYWYNSCNVKGTRRYDCNSTQTCTNGQCINNNNNNNNNNAGSESSILNLKVDSSGRYLVKIDGTPFFMTGDTAWSMITQLNKADADLYLQSRSESGFNAVLVNLIERKYSDKAPSNIYNAAPFTGKLFTTPNEAYFAHADYIIQSAKEKGIVVLLAPIYLDTDEGWGDETLLASESDMLAWGRYVGNRYKDYDNIIWVIGGDINPTFADSKARKVVEGIKQYNPDALFTSHTTNEKMAIDYWSDTSWINVNNIYSYGSNVPVVAEKADSRSPIKPFFLLEGVYENDGNDLTVQELRAQAYWTVLAGGFGHLFGNCPLWHFNSFTASHYCGSNIDWKGELDSEGTKGMIYHKNLFESRDWHKLVPDFNNAVLTAGYGTIGQSNYAMAAYTSDRSTIIVYTPVQRTMTINTGMLSGTSMRAWWYNPRDGTHIALGTATKTASKTYTTPTTSGSDWILVIDDASKNFGAPGTTTSVNPTLYCGDNSCNNGETCSSCAGDCGACAVINPFTIYKVWDFENRPEGTYTPVMADEDFTVYQKWLHGDESQIAMDSINGKSTKVIKSVIPNSGDPFRGFQLNTYLDKEHTEYNELYLSYDIKLGDRVTIENLRCKIPGLRGMPEVDNELPLPTNQGFICHLMIRGGTPFTYHYDRTRLRGDNNCAPNYGYLPWACNGFEFYDIDFVPDKWYSITQRVVINSYTNGEPNSDGIYEVWVDGKLIFQEDYLIILADSTKGIDGVSMSAYCNDVSAITTDIKMDNFVVWTNKNDATYGTRKLHSANGDLIIPGAATSQTVCTPQSASATCRGKCGVQKNNCGQDVNCGACTTSGTGTGTGSSNILANGFENSGNLVLPFTGITNNGIMQIDSITAYQGTYSLMLNGRGSYYYTQPDSGSGGIVMPISDGDLINFSVYVKGEQGATAGMMILCLGDQLNYWQESNGYYGVEFQPLTNWARESISYVCPSWAKYAGVRLSVRNNGRVWYDNPVLTKTSRSGTTAITASSQSTSTATSGTISANGVEIIYKNTFEHDTLGSYRDDEIAKDWNHGPYNSKKGHVYIEQNINDVSNPSKYIRVFHKKGTYGGTVPYEDSGTELSQYLAEGYEELYFSYRIKIQEGFESHATKGKIPSMEGYLKPISAGQCAHGDDSFWGAMQFVPVSGGIGIAPFIYHVDMWKNTFNSFMNYERFGSTCDEVYAKLKDDPSYGGVYGSGSTIQGLTMTTGKWHTVTERIVVNEIGKNNGIVEIYLDGKLYSQRTDYTFRTVENLKINFLSFNSFFGGGPESSAVEDTNFYFDDFVAYRFKSGYGQPVGNTPSAANRMLPAIAIN